MIERRKFEDLGHADHGWIRARHHFSFADYHDPARMGRGSLRVWKRAVYALGTGRHAYLVLAGGALEVNDVRLNARDGATIRDESVLRVRALEGAEILLVDAV